MFARARRLIGAVALLARDGRIPRPLRWLAAFGLLPVPGPVDEGALLVVGVLLLALYRDVLRDAWNRTAVSRAGGSPRPPQEPPD